MSLLFVCLFTTSLRIVSSILNKRTCQGKMVLTMARKKNDKSLDTPVSQAGPHLQSIMLMK